MVRFDREVESYWRFKGKIIWIDGDGEENPYTPDFEISYRPSKEGKPRRNRVVEVKPDFTPDPYDRKKNLPRRESPARNEKKWRAAKKQLALQGKEFVVVRSNEIETDYLENVKFLLMYRDHPSSGRNADLFTDVLKGKGAMTLRELTTTLTTDRQRRAELLPTLYGLIADGTVKLDLTRILCFDSILEMP